MHETYTLSGLLSMAAVCALLFLIYRRYPTRFWKTVFKKFAFAAFGVALLLMLPLFETEEPLPVEVPPTFEEDSHIQLTATASPYAYGLSEITFTISIADPAVKYIAGND